VGILQTGLAGVELWTEVGLIWRNDKGRLVPFERGTRPPWGWLVGMEEADPSEEDPAPQQITLDGFDDPESSDLDRALFLASQLLVGGRTEVTARDFAMIGEPDEALVADPRRLGMALSSLGVPSYRIRQAGGQARMYDLRPLLARTVAGGTTNSGPSGPPESEPSASMNGSVDRDPPGPLRGDADRRADL